MVHDRFSTRMDCIYTFGDCGAANTARSTRSFRGRRLMPLSLYIIINTVNIPPPLSCGDENDTGEVLFIIYIQGDSPIMFIPFFRLITNSFKF